MVNFQGFQFGVALAAHQAAAKTLTSSRIPTTDLRYDFDQSLSLLPNQLVGYFLVGSTAAIRGQPSTDHLEIKK